MWIAIGLVGFLVFMYFRDATRFETQKTVVNNKVPVISQVAEIDLDNSALHHYNIGVLYQECLSFVNAEKHYLKSLEIITKQKTEISGVIPVLHSHPELTERLKENIGYIRKPLPWGGGHIKDQSDSTIYFALIDRFGNNRFSMYDNEEYFY